MPTSTSRSGNPPACTMDMVLNSGKGPQPNNTSSANTPGGDINKSNNNIFLDIPLTNVFLLAEHFVGRIESPRTVKIKRDKRFMDIGDLSLLNTLLADPEEPQPLQTTTLNETKLTNIDHAVRKTKKKLLYYLSKPPTSVCFVVNGVGMKIKCPKSKQQTKRSSKTISNNKIHQNSNSSSPKVPYGNLKRYFKLDSRCIKKQSRLPKTRILTPTSDNASKERTKLGKLGGLNLQKYLNFDFFTKPELLSQFKLTHSHGYLPDLYKMRAINAWQTDKIDDCIYYLSMAKGKFVESEIIDKHCAYLARLEESHGTRVSPDQCKKKRIFKLQTKNLLSFEDSKESLRKSVDSIDGAWNVIELTTDHHHYNRFGNSFVETRHTPGLFITAHISIPGTSTRHTHVTYVPTPTSEPGVNKSILEEFLKVMHSNRLINEGYQGDRKQYWETRKEHNEQLMNILKSIEENWIYPWGFLFIGNIPTQKVITKITGCIRNIETILGEIKPSLKGVLYKLIENYNIVNQRSKELVPKLISYLFDHSESKLNTVIQKIAQVGSTIDSDRTEYRNPTILVLDQGIDQLPWEAMSILEHTPVTRVPSITLIQSLVNIHNLRSHKGFDTKNCFYLLNPDQTLAAVEQRLKNYFDSHPTWFGIVGKPPTNEQVEDAIQNKEVYLYCGHGCGSNYITECTLTKLACNSIPLLMGCGSLKFVNQGPKTGPQSTVVSYFAAACISMVGYLWEITDLECDRMTVDLIERFMGPTDEKPKEIVEFDGMVKRERELCLATAVLLCRDAPTQFLTKAAVVNYGIPVKGRLW